MQIQISTDHNITGSAAITAETTATVEHALRRFSDHITRVEVHIGDENGPKAGGDDIRCMLEARIAHRQPIAVTHHADSVPLAVQGAADNLVALIEHTLGRAEGHREAARE